MKPQRPVTNHTHNGGAEGHRSRPLNGDWIESDQWWMGKRVETAPPLLFKVSYGTSYSWDVFLIGDK
ncbi:hypothetical protein KY285_030955 [Solanum tuberosum]|nr:hypothetical protein KY285_030955 [Solanum tuberosum]